MQSITGIRLGMCTALLAGLLLFCEAYSAELYTGPNGGQPEPGRSSDTEIVFYGRVMDQNGQPVAKAKITAAAEYFNLNGIRFIGAETLRAETDAEGRFVFTGLLVKKLYIRSIEKRGCEFPEQDVVKAFSYEAIGAEPAFKPDPDTPVVFKMNKKYDPGFVANKKSTLFIKPDRGIFTVDVFKGFSDPLKKLSPDGGSPDMVVSVLPARDHNGAYRVEIRSPGKKSGLAEKEGLPHSAPDRGYVPALAYAVSARQKAQITVYHNGRGGKLYSRLALSLASEREAIRIDAELFTNVEGLRNTDFDPFYTEDRLFEITGQHISYGAKSCREIIARVLQDTIGHVP